MKTTLSLFSLAILLLAGCTDPITVGSELLDADRADTGETTDVTFTTRVVREDSLFTFNGLNPTAPSTFTFGQIEDANFGATRHSAYLVPRLPRSTASGLPLVPLFAQRTDITIDSAVLILPIDTARAFYGAGRTFPVRGTEIITPIPFDEDAYSTFTTPTNMVNLLAQSSFTGSLTPTEVRDTSITGRSFRRAHIRIRMAEPFIDLIRNLPATAYDADSTFRDNFAGIYLEPDGVSDGLITLLPAEVASTAADTLYNGFNIYYRDTTGAPSEYRISFRQILPNYAFDFSNSLVGELLADGADNDLTALVGQGGLVTQLDFTDLASLSDRVINRAVLEIPIADVEGVSYTDYPVPSRVELWYRPSSDAELAFITDRVELTRTGAGATGFNSFLGGRLNTEDGIQLYSPAFTVHMQRIVDGEVPPTVYLRVTPLASTEFRSARVFLNGPDSAEHPARVRLTFTKLD
ncbi:hypothetical protein GGR28_000998 [Lewinella aquimaris]|uniref:DUF4270 family protein n=1 Tax=Neolewinella aquimaris TaxID=1835722 RepID=A0A840E3Z5_9BACT|nr:DUF4270 family protein [Neolewinella aquimaris]MBB4078385.1 hypothetical protein [Neolewinella aquimaris]